MFSAIAVIVKKQEPGDSSTSIVAEKKKRTKTKTPGKPKVPKAYDDAGVEFSEFVALPRETDVPEAAPLDDIATNAFEIDAEPETTADDEWREIMQAAEREADEWETDSKTDPVASDLEFDDEYVADDTDEYFEDWKRTSVTVGNFKETKPGKKFAGPALDFDTEFA